ncbi:MAG: AAA family ATPase, partial [Gammaproteobacteria bacterium]|nr:AAA family ATPase [Gammaproteobacteria bacterium]
MIAGTNSGVGKTTVTLGIMSALIQKGINVQGFKSGPDYIDPSHHTFVTGNASRNLDTWVMDNNTCRELFERSAVNSDLSVIEG